MAEYSPQFVRRCADPELSRNTLHGNSGTKAEDFVVTSSGTYKTTKGRHITPYFPTIVKEEPAKGRLEKRRNLQETALSKLRLMNGFQNA